MAYSKESGFLHSEIQTPTILKEILQPINQYFERKAAHNRELHIANEAVAFLEGRRDTPPAQMEGLISIFDRKNPDKFQGRKIIKSGAQIYPH